MRYDLILPLFPLDWEQGDSVNSSLSGVALFPPSATTPKALLPGDPNEVFGPSGQVSPGQILSYTIQFENEGQGTAYGVYVTDVLDLNIDDTTLTIGNFQAINFVAGSTVSTEEELLCG